MKVNEISGEMPSIKGKTLKKCPWIKYEKHADVLPMSLLIETDEDIALEYIMFAKTHT